MEGRAMMEPFVRHTGRLAALARANVDTDQIIPKQFLKRVERTGFGPALFHDWRFRPDGSANPDFELNHPGARGASILLAGENFRGEMLLHGLDESGRTMRFEDRIGAYEKNRDAGCGMREAS